jgi:hypothetical protein
LPSQILRWSVPDLSLISTNELPDSSEPLVLPRLESKGRWLVAGLPPNLTGFWDLEKNICVGRFPTAYTGVGQVRVGHLRASAFSRSGRYLATSFHDWTVIHVTDFLDEEKPVRSMTARHRGHVTSLAFSADERTLISGDSDKFIKIWDVKTMEERATLLGHRLAVTAVDISPDGRTAVSCSEDSSVRLWNVETQREVARFEGHGVMVEAAFAPDGNTLFLTTRGTGDKAPVTMVWRAPTLAESDVKSEARSGL